MRIVTYNKYLETGVGYAYKPQEIHGMLAQ